VFVIGNLPYKGQSAWAVLQSTDQGNTWVVRDLYPAASQGHGIAVDSQGTLYTAGIVGNTWTTRRSTNAGASWSTTDSFYYTSKGGKNAGYQSGAYSVSFDYLNNVYVAGYADVAGQGSHWTVRKLPVGGSSWVTSDDFQLVTGQNATPPEHQASILSANSGHLLMVIGSASDSSSVAHLITRRLTIP
jgi:hypothetical protein